MKTITLIQTILFITSLTLLTACNQETPAPMNPKPALAAANKAADVASQNAGQRIYETSCASCHDSGMMGAPKIGDKAAWAGHFEHGMEHMVGNVISGIGKMPPRGGNPNLSDADVKMAVEYLIGKSK